MLHRFGGSLAIKLMLALSLLVSASNVAFAEDDNDVLIIDDGDEDTAQKVDPSVPASSALFIGTHQSLLAVDTSFDGGQEDIIEWRNRLDLSISMDVSSDLRVVASGRMKYWLLIEDSQEADDFRKDTQRGIFEGSLRDTYVLWRLGSGFDLTIGNRTFS